MGREGLGRAPNPLHKIFAHTFEKNRLGIGIAYHCKLWPTIVHYCLLFAIGNAFTICPRLRRQPGPGPGRLGWLAWFKMLLGLGGGVGVVGRGKILQVFVNKQ